MTMHHSAPSLYGKTLALVLAAGLFTATLANAADSALDQDARKVGHVTGEAVHTVAKDAKKAGVAIGHAAKKVGKEIGTAAQEGGKEFKHAVNGNRG